MKWPDLAPLTSLIVTVLSVGGILLLAILRREIPPALIYIALGSTVGFTVSSAQRGTTPPPPPPREGGGS